ESTTVTQYQGRPLDSYAPDPALGFTGMDNGNGADVKLSWTAVSPPENDLRGYNIYRYNVQTGTVPVKILFNATVYIDTVPLPGTTYYYEIFAQDMSDNLSGPSSLSVFVNDVSVFPPYAISVESLPTGRSVKLTWEISGFPKEIWIYRAASASTSAVFGVDPSTRLAAPATFYFDDAGLSDGTSYYYGIKAVNYVYESVIFKSTNTEIYTAFPSDAISPTAPADFKAILSFGANGIRNIKLSWNKVTLNEGGSECGDLAGYEMWWRSEGGAAWDPAATETIDSGDTLEWTHSNLAATTWYYMIRAFDGSASPHYSTFSSSISIYCAAVIDYNFSSDGRSAVTFTPNGDGIADSLDINFTLNQASTTVGIKVYNLKTGDFVAEVLPETYYAEVSSTSVKWSPTAGIPPDGIYSVEFWINGAEYSSTFITIQGSAQIPPSANNYPNPFIMSQHDSTKIRWRMDSSASVKIAVYNIVGMLVKTWEISQNDVESDGQYWKSVNEDGGIWCELPWDGRNGKGRKVGSGIYICLIRGGSVNEKIKIAVIR
ncbi:hypothetical protein KJ633_08110, partial [bacterium]|nr:hypothetical protein [bacterium]